MIESFRHKGLKRLYETGDTSKVRADQVRRIEVVLAALDAAQSVAQLDRPSFDLHPLKGGRRGFWSIWVNGNWRIVFRFEGENVHDVDLVDYH